MEYCVLQNRFLDILEADVAEKIKEGWIPQGGVGSSVDKNEKTLEETPVYFQALTRKVNAESEEELHPASI